MNEHFDGVLLRSAKVCSGVLAKRLIKLTLMRNLVDGCRDVKTVNVIQACELLY